MRQYLDLLQYVLDNGVEKDDRTKTGTISTFGYQMSFDLSNNFPLLTTKKMFTKGIIHELLWIISGSTNVKYLQDNGVKIWNDWADKDGNLGPVYGAMWRSWPTTTLDKGTIDQFKNVINQIKNNPNSRRHIVTAWNPEFIDQQVLPPCHCFFQFYVSNGKLSCQLYQRSADVFLGVPFNIASYALLTMMVAQVCDLEPGKFVHTFGDVHIYKNHINQVKLQLTREPLPLPKIIINPAIKNIDDFVYDDFELIDYQSHSAIKGKVSV